MLIIKALDPSASVAFSEYTNKWYVASRLEIGNGVTLTSPNEHRDSPEDAVLSYFAALTNLSAGEYVVSRYLAIRREWTWNGAAFAECTGRSGLEVAS